MRNVIYVRRKGRLHPRPVRLYILSFFIFFEEFAFTCASHDVFNVFWSR